MKVLGEFFYTKYKNYEDIGLFFCRIKVVATRLRDALHQLDNLYLDFQMIRYLRMEFQGAEQQIYRWKDTEFTPVKIESELILEGNTLQLIKQ